MRIIPLDRADAEFRADDAEAPFVIPTETVYGLAARIDREAALREVYAIKGRPADNPLIVHVSSEAMLRRVAAGPVPPAYRRLMDAFWPGPLSLLFRARADVSPVLRAGGGTVAVRMPAGAALRRLIERVGAPLAAPSANTSGKPSPTRVEHAVADLGARVATYIDGGPAAAGLESTVVGLGADGAVLLLRPGVVTREDLERVLGAPVAVAAAAPGAPPACPGQKYRHYAPSVPLYLFRSAAWPADMRRVAAELRGARVGVLRFGDEECPPAHRVYGLGGSKREWCRNVFSGLLALEKECDAIFVHSVGPEDEGLAIMDRLTRAAAHIIE